MANEKRLIDAYSLMKKVDESKQDNPHTDNRLYINHHNEHNHFLRMIFCEQPVDAVEVVHGRWEDGICTMCGYPIPTDSKYDFIDKDDCLFCYHCGAKMDGGNEDG